jgi:ribosome biogenesis GTPase / thiamine phosphate phosphatase
MALSNLGWSAREAEAFERYAQEGLVPARVAVAYGATFRVYVEGGEALADVAGRLRHEAATRRDLPAVGDWVAVRQRPGERATIQAILPRTSVFSRKVAGSETVEQIVAANVDIAFLLAGLDNDFNLRRVERYLAMTRASGASPVVVLNKSDLVEDLPAWIEQMRTIAAGAPIHAISSKFGHGLDELAQYLRPGLTVAVVGSSGVGKSTLINRLLGAERQRTREVRASDQRGRHTTTHRELVVLPGGALLVDTPGMRELQLWSADEGLTETFEDIDTLATSCYFTDCQHRTEPRCAVKAAVEEGRIPADRLAGYHKLQDEQQHLLDRQDALALQQEKKHVRTIHRAMRKRPDKRR